MSVHLTNHMQVNVLEYCRESSAEDQVMQKDQEDEGSSKARES